jgi:hypothetical protein
MQESDHFGTCKNRIIFPWTESKKSTRRTARAIDKSRFRRFHIGVSETTPNANEPKLEGLTAELMKTRAERDELKRAYLDLLVTCRNLERGILFQGRERIIDGGSATL